MQNIKKALLFSLLSSVGLCAQENNWQEKENRNISKKIEQIKTKLTLQKKKTPNTTPGTLKKWVGAPFLYTGCLTTIAAACVSHLNDQLIEHGNGGLDPLSLYFASIFSFAVGGYLSYTGAQDQTQAIANHKQAVENLRTMRNQYQQLIEDLHNEQPENEYSIAKLKTKLEHAKQKLTQAKNRITETTLATLKKIFSAPLMFSGACFTLLSASLLFTDMDDAPENVQQDFFGSGAYFTIGTILSAIGGLLYYSGHCETEKIKTYKNERIAYFSKRVQEYTQQLAKPEKQNNLTSNNEKE